MTENNNIQNVTIVTSIVNLRATSLRSRLTDVVTLYKIDNTSDEYRIAYDQFKDAFLKLEQLLAS